jgi:DNA modification methylase
VASLKKSDKERIIELLDKGEDLPLDYKHLLFPPEKKEYELVYAGKEREEDILADTMAVPLQPIKTFDGNGNDWTNKLIFGDNLQILKSLQDDPEVKGQVKLIYIHPPFGTGDEYGSINGEKAYTAKLKGTHFIEFFRKRILFLRDILADDGCIFVRLDYHFSHYFKVIMDEVLLFRNEIIINRIHKRLRNLKRFNVSTECILFYSKNENFQFFNPEAPRKCNYCGAEKDSIWEDLTSPGLRNPPERIILGRNLLPRRGRHFSYTQSKINKMENEGRIRLNKDISYYDLNGTKIDFRPEYLQTENVPLDNNWTDIKGYAFMTGYPTENHEELLARVIQAGSKEGDIVLDSFAGSGTTIAVAEKLGRRWIAIDCGKFAIYTMQKRLLNLKSEIGNKGKKLKSNPFTLYHAGLYDFAMLKKLPWLEWRKFALLLFNCRDDKHRVSGLELDGYKGRSDVMVFDYQKEGGVVLDYGFIDDLHSMIGSKIGSQFFIIAPAASVVFLEDYIDKGSIRYYILRIPYSIINELHSKDFEAIKQPIDESQVNNTVDAVGFDFIRQPKVACSYSIEKPKGQLLGYAVIKIKTFKSEAMLKGASQLENRKSLSMIMVDFDYDGEIFNLDKSYYASEIEKNGWKVLLPLENLKKQIMIIYLDIYGNEYREIKTPQDFSNPKYVKRGGK